MKDPARPWPQPNQIHFASFVVFVVPLCSFGKGGTTKETKDTKTIQRKKGSTDFADFHR